ncbi:exported hypothetical protein [uncultured Desulfobacterium sp.]|uniref:LamG-like jellyroll fold domain-containing protein n=1 Tax=uncultured Desulfobacterium sp. TaxID=201089 RepID=A0A445N157_9BACT|nr:exported hypothetical protein [uncultured Desulfobacterium sp.]
MKKLVMFFAVVILLGSFSGSAQSDLLFSASMRNGDYGGGTAVDTMDGIYGHGASPHVLGIVNSAQGTTFTSTETDGRSNAIINWVISNATQRSNFRNHGTFSFWVRFDSATFCQGWVLGDNYGFDQFYHGQGTFGSHAYKKDDGVMLSWSAWWNSIWDYPYDNTNRLQYDRWYNVGYAWGGPDNDFEIWVDGVLVSARDWGSGYSFPWGMDYPPSGINFGFGDNHERGYDSYGSVAGATFADVHIWNEYRVLGDTVGEVNSVCASAKLKAIAAYVSGLINCEAKGKGVDDCNGKASAKFEGNPDKLGAWDKAQAKADKDKKNTNCDTGSIDVIISDISSALDEIYGIINTEIGSGDKNAAKLRSSILKASGKLCSAQLKAQSAYVKGKAKDTGKAGTAFDKASGKANDAYDKSYGKLKTKYQTFDFTELDGLKDKINTLVDIIVNDMRLSH